MVEPAQISAEGGSNPVVKMRSPSSIDINSGTSSSSESDRISGAGPSEQVSIRRISALREIRSCQASSLQPVQQRGGHLDILTSLVSQLISGLCLRSQECPRMSFSLPKLVTANKVLSE